MARKKHEDPRSRSKRNKARQDEIMYDDEYANALNGEYMDDPLYQEYEEEEGITLKTSKRATRYLIIALLFMIIAIGAVLGYRTMRANAISNQADSCWGQEVAIEALVNEYVDANGFSSLPAYIEDVPGYKQAFVACPSGGEYTWNPITGEYSCSMHKHYTPEFAAAHSELLGQDVSNLVTNNSSQ